MDLGPYIYIELNSTMNDFGTAVALSPSGDLAAALAGRVRENDGQTGVYRLNTRTFNSSLIDGCVELALAKNKVILGCPHYKDHGAVLLFRASSAELLATIQKVDVSDGDEFGRSIAITEQGDKILVGADKERWPSNGAKGAGSVYLYDGAGHLLRKFNNPLNGTDSNFFGRSVAMNRAGSLIIIGADNVGGPALYPNCCDATSPNHGAAFLYNDLGELLQTYLNPDPEQVSFFGYAVSMTKIGHRVAISAPFVSGTETAAITGKVYIFHTHTYSSDEPSWLTLDSPDPTDQDLFGASISFTTSGDLLAVGAPQHSPSPDLYEAGVVYLFDGSGGFLRRIDSPRPAAGARFGAAVSIDGEGKKVIIGAPHGKKKSAGVAYIICLDQEYCANSEWTNGMVSETTTRSDSVSPVSELGDFAWTTPKLFSVVVLIAILFAGPLYALRRRVRRTETIGMQRVPTEEPIDLEMKVIVNQGIELSPVTPNQDRMRQVPREEGPSSTVSTPPSKAGASGANTATETSRVFLSQRQLLQQPLISGTHGDNEH